jgi:peptidoglycan-N-acetylglucosamine deacetylase
MRIFSTPRLRTTSVLLSATLLGLTISTASASDCPNPSRAFPTSRIVEVDASNGPIFGVETRRQYEPNFLRPKEVILSFDDGPLPPITRTILKTLSDYCAHATFYSVGQMALAFPDVVKETMAAGHTMATHTFTHPFNMHRLDPAKAQDEIDRGFAAVTAAAGQPISPFFRFPGLADSNDLLNFLRSRGVAAFTVDVISNDSYATSAAALTHNVLNLVDQTQGGIILFHDIKKVTAQALPAILNGLKRKGYTLVHVVSKTQHTVAPALLAEMQEELRKEQEKRGRKFGPLAISGADQPAPQQGASVPPALAALAVDRIAPPLRDRPPSNDGPKAAKAKPKIDGLRRLSTTLSERRRTKRQSRALRATRPASTVY